MNIKQKPFEIGTIVKHFKRETIADSSENNNNVYLYVIRDYAWRTEDESFMVIYEVLYPPFRTYARPFDMFFSEVDRNKYPDIKQRYRFERYDG